VNPAEIKALIEEGLPDATVQVATDGLGHYEAVVISEQFTGKRRVPRHQMVYATLGERVGREIHALAVKTYTPDEWRSADESTAH
jgi:acid stress-induced BolA-like protein IbaG/YrbA